MRKLRLGIIGLSEGNGHPYSWSAIFNGYNASVMKRCPFPVIFEYLSKQEFPRDSLKDGCVTHIWTQNKTLSKDIAKACYIKNIVDKYTDFIGEVDAVLLARDDADLHYKMSEPFLKAGLPIYIDKPLSYDIKTAKKIYSLEKYKGQIFTCSALSYAKEFQLSAEDRKEVGSIKYIDACVMKSWDKYGIHIVEPVLKIIGRQGKIRDIKSLTLGDKKIVCVEWESGLIVNFSALGKNLASPIAMRVFGEKGFKELTFRDTFSAFKASLKAFTDVVLKRNKPPSREFVLGVIKIIEEGSKR